MVEFKIVRKNPVTGKLETDYELFKTVKQAEQLNDSDPDITVDFDSMIDWDHSENKYEWWG